MISNAAMVVLLAVADGGESVDAILAEAWQSAEVKPAPVCSDREFLRRASLDIIGRIPTLAELREFEKDPDRPAKIDQLLASEEFPRFWSEVWTATLVGYNDEFASDREVLRQWLEAAFRRDMPYDRIVTRLIAARGTSAFDGPVNFLVRYAEEEPAVRVSRLFLGVRLDCARCHDHPFDRWKKEDFELMNRFFEATDFQEVSEGNIRLVNDRPGEDAERPRFLTGARPRTSQWRDELALFMTNSKPFARTFANRMWYHFLGRGIVDPVDDFNRKNPAAMPKLMEYLANKAREDRFGIRPMIRRICNSRAYQLSSQRREPQPENEALFAYRVLKPLTPQQAFDSAVVALGLRPRERQREEFIERIVGQSLDEDFSHTWQYRETVQELMSRLTRSLPVPTQSVDELYLRILSRRPTERERQLCRGRSSRDIVFALINSNEFFFNH